MDEKNVDGNKAREFCFTNGNDEFKLELEPLRLLKNNNKVEIQGKFLSVLEVLVDRRDRIVEHDELIKLVWADNHYTGKQGILRAINGLRKILEMDSKSPTVIVSYYGKGYRFFENELDKEEQPESAVGNLATQKSWLQQYGTVVVTTVALLVAFFSFFNQSSSPTIDGVQTLTVTQIKPTFESEQQIDEYMGALSPSSEQILYLTKDSSQQVDLWFARLEPYYQAFRVTDDTKEEGGLSWSPDGNKFAYLSLDKEAEKCTVNLGDTQSLEISEVARCNELISPSSDTSSLDFSADGKYLIFPVQQEEDGERTQGLFQYDIASGELSLMMDNTPDSYLDSQPTWSPEGSLLAYLVVNFDLSESIRVVDRKLQLVREIPNLNSVKGIDWYSNNILLFSEYKDSNRAIYQFDVNAGKINPLPINRYKDVAHPKFNGVNLTYTQTETESSIKSLNTTTLESNKINDSGSQRQLSVSINNDGDIAYLSNESGKWSLYIQRPEQEPKFVVNTEELTQLSWSKSGDYLAFINKDSSGSSLRIYNRYTEKVESLVNNQSQFSTIFNPYFSQCSSKIYFSSTSKLEETSLWSYQLDASKVLKEHPIGFKVRETENCKSALISTITNPQLVIKDLENGTTRVAIDNFNYYSSFNWDLHANQLKYVENDKLIYRELEQFNVTNSIDLAAFKVQPYSNIAFHNEDLYFTSISKNQSKVYTAEISLQRDEVSSR